MRTFKIAFLSMLMTGYLSAQDQPNIVYILCDDLGYGDIHVLNPERGKIPTPQIDSFSTESMTFTDAHSASSVCTPSRYSILTGRYAWRSRLQEGVLAGGEELTPLIPEDRLTVPKALKQKGYTTAAIGKWHLGFNYVNEEGQQYEIYDGKKVIGPPIGAIVPDGPITRGFDSYIGFHHSRVMKTVVKNDKVIDMMDPKKMLQFLASETEEYIAKAATKKEPFFLYLALNSPHTPILPSKKWQGKSGMTPYADYVMETDAVVGRVLKALEKSGISDNTLVIFTSDNGCSFPATKGNELEQKFGHYPSANFRGAKSDIWDGGHRIPFMVRWPGHIEANSSSDQLICLSNLMATCADIVGLNIPDTAGEDSYSILPILKNKKAKTDYKLVVHHSINGKFSLRSKKWKLELTPGSGGWSNPTDAKAIKEDLPNVQLYNMKKDEEETTNLYAKYPKRVKRMTEELVQLVEKGRTTSGLKQNNDVAVDIFKAKPIKTATED